MKLIFGNGQEIEVFDVFEAEEYCIDSNRRTLTAICKPDVFSFDALNTILSDTFNTGELSVVDMTTEEKVEDGELIITEIPEAKTYSGYTIKIFVGIEKAQVQPESPDTPAVYADSLVFKLGRPTHLEQQLDKLWATANRLMSKGSEQI